MLKRLVQIHQKISRLFIEQDILFSLFINKFPSSRFLVELNIFFVFTLNFMPLVTITGIPLSGKTQRANELKNALEKCIQDSNRKIIIVNEESLLIEKQEAYKGI
jgi:hypothetical protein